MIMKLLTVFSKCVLSLLCLNYNDTEMPGACTKHMLADPLLLKSSAEWEASSGLTSTI